MVGSCQTVSAEAAFAPKMNLTLIKEPRLYARLVVANAKQFACLNKLWNQESHWNSKAKNPHSTAFGIPQFLNQTWENYGYALRPSNPITQVNAGLKYIKVRYGSDCNAYRHEIRYGWY